MLPIIETHQSRTAKNIGEISKLFSPKSVIQHIAVEGGLIGAVALFGGRDLGLWAVAGFAAINVMEVGVAALKVQRLRLIISHLEYLSESQRAKN